MFRGFREVRNESEIIERRNFEKRLAELDKPMFEVEDAEKEKRALEEKFKELNRKMLEEVGPLL